MMDFSLVGFSLISGPYPVSRGGTHEGGSNSVGYSWSKFIQGLEYSIHEVPEWEDVTITFELNSNTSLIIYKLLPGYGVEDMGNEDAYRVNKGLPDYHHEHIFAMSRFLTDMRGMFRANRIDNFFGNND